MPGEHDLATLLSSMEPTLLDSEVVFVTVPDRFDTTDAIAQIREPEGLTVVLRLDDADDSGLAYDYVGAWITLTVHSDLAAVGLTAAVSTALASEDISCNVISGFFHDHLVVPWDRRHDAMTTLASLAARR
jgi:hypothetical protein